MAVSSNNRFLTSSLLGCAFAALATGIVAPAAAQETGQAESDEIVVTAQRRSERSVDVPIAITSVTGDQLEAAGADSLSDLASLAPALRFDSAATFVQPTIRGVGTAVATSGGGSNVGIYIDGFYSPNPAVADFQLMNVESVQVLRGPQGTLFGRNTTGGAILVTTATPSTETSGEVSASYGRFNAQRYQGYATFGLSDSIAFDIEGLLSTGDGFVHNITTNSDDDGAYENWAVRTGLNVDLTDSISVLLRYSHSDTDDPTLMNTNTYRGPDIPVGTLFPAGITSNPDEVGTSGPSEYLSENDALQLTVSMDLGFADLTSYTQLRTEDTLMVEDLDHTPGVRPFVLHIDVQDETFSQEFLLTSHAGTRLQWTAGLFYLSNEDTWTTNIGVNQPNNLSSTRLGGSGTTTVSYAAFFDGTYELTPQWYLTLGARYSHDEVTDSYYINPIFFNPTLAHTNVPDLEDDTVTPRVVLRYEPTDNSSIYVSYTQGYKAGVLDVGGGTGNPVAPEEITAYEVGYKFDNRRIAFDLSAYHYDYQNLQVSLYKDNGSGSPSAAILNAAESEIYGVEAQIRYQVTDNFSYNAGVAWTHGRYERFDNAPLYVACPNPGVPDFITPGVGCRTGAESFYVPVSPAAPGYLPAQTLSNVTMQRTPEWTANLGARYETDLAGGELALMGNVYYTSKFYFGPSGIQFPQEAYTLVNVRGEWTDPSDHFTLALYADNLTDERYRTQVQYNQYGIGAVWSAPTTYGIELGYRF